MEKTKPGVLIISNMLSGAGLARGASEELADRMRGLGYPVTAASSIPNRGLRLLDMLVATWKHRHSYAVALVDVFSDASFFWAEAVCQLLRRLDKPYILTLRGGNLPAFAARHPRRVRRLLCSAATVTAPSKFLQQELLRFRSDIIELPNAIQCDRYQYRPQLRPQPKLVWLRSFHRIYDPALAPRVLREISTAFPESRLIMVGKDKQDGSLNAAMATAERFSVLDRCEFRPSVPKHRVPEVLAMGDIFLNTTTIDNTPVCVLEAAACGMCIVSTDVGGISHLLTNNHNAILVRPGDERAMARAVCEILTNPELAATLSANARRMALGFNWPLILRQWEELIESCYLGIG